MCVGLRTRRTEKFTPTLTRPHRGGGDRKWSNAAAGEMCERRSIQNEGEVSAGGYFAFTLEVMDSITMDAILNWASRSVMA